MARERIYQTDALRQRAYRERRRAELAVLRDTVHRKRRPRPSRRNRPPAEHPVGTSPFGSALRLLQGDCLELMQTVPAGSVDLILVDPPHGRTQADWDRIIPLAPLWEAYRRLLRPHGAVLIFATQPFTSHVVGSSPHLGRRGQWFRYELVWEKSKASCPLNAKRRPMPAHESILVFSPQRPRYFPQMTEGEPYDKGLTKAQSERDIYGKHGQVVVASAGERYPRSVIYWPTAETEPDRGLHKSQKPLGLLSYLIRTYSQSGECVLDHAMGSGSTGAAALSLGRAFIGIEKDFAFFAQARERLSAGGG